MDSMRDSPLIACNILAQFPLRAVVATPARGRWRCEQVDLTREPLKLHRIKQLAEASMARQLHPAFAEVFARCFGRPTRSLRFGC